jgi:hypothetical protein
LRTGLINHQGRDAFPAGADAIQQPRHIDARLRTLEWTIVSSCSDGSDRRRHQCAQLFARQGQHSALATSDADGFGKCDKRYPRNSIESGMETAVRWRVCVSSR